MQNLNRINIKFFSNKARSQRFKNFKKSPFKFERERISCGNDLTYKMPNDKYSRNIKRIYDNGHDKYRYRKSIDNPEDKNNKE